MLSVNFPDELVVQILTKTPAKSLVRFKLVSKSWEQLFRDLNFVHEHKQTRAAITKNGRFLARGGAYNFSYKQYRFLYRVNETTELSCEDVSFPFIQEKEDMGILVSAEADGIFFLECWNVAKGNYHLGNIYILWNPSTGEFTKLPSLVPSETHYCLQQLVGLDFDFKSSFFKVVTVYSANPIGTFDVVRTAALWTSTIGSWREIDSVPRIDKKLRELYFRQKYYWYVIMSTSYQRSIISFDFVDEKFRFISMPKIDDNDWHYYREGSIIELKESIGFVRFYPPSGDRFDIWMLSNEVMDGGSASWSMYLTLEAPYESLSYLHSLRPFCMESDLVFINGEGELSFHNVASGETSSSGQKFAEFFVYNESMISFKETSKNTLMV